MGLEENIQETRNEGRIGELKQLKHSQKNITETKLKLGSIREN